jgi:hypothetical protein
MYEVATKMHEVSAYAERAGRARCRQVLIPDWAFLLRRVRPDPDARPHDSNWPPGRRVKMHGRAIGGRKERSRRVPCPTFSGQRR